MLAWLPVLLDQRAASGQGPLQAGYCTRVGVYWPGVLLVALVTVLSHDF